MIGYELLSQRMICLLGIYAPGIFGELSFSNCINWFLNCCLTSFIFKYSCLLIAKQYSFTEEQLNIFLSYFDYLKKVPGGSWFLFIVTKSPFPAKPNKHFWSVLVWNDMSESVCVCVCVCVCMCVCVYTVHD